MDTARRNKLAAIELGLLLATAITLRFINLGYSDFQGDEISAICHPSHFSSLIKFLGYLLGQQKGPVQYLITCAIWPGRSCLLQRTPTQTALRSWPMSSP